jgi:hypothetical protein
LPANARSSAAVSSADLARQLAATVLAISAVTIEWPSMQLEKLNRGQRRAQSGSYAPGHRPHGRQSLPKSAKRAQRAAKIDTRNS